MSLTTESIQARAMLGRVTVDSHKKRGGVTQYASVDFPKEDAPAVALAILEAAGIGHKAYQPGEMRHLTEVAHDALNRHQKERAERAEREAEDAKIRKFFSTMWPDGSATVGKVTDTMRAEYETARKFFEDSVKPAPRVLNYGDPEPDLNTKWRDTQGDVWAYGASMWRTNRSDGIRVGAVDCWSHQLSSFFPMTEVTECAS